MATIYDIAELCEVSASTVSRALSRPELVRAEVRERILEVAADLGYRTNRTARRLAEGKSGLVAVVVPDLANLFFPPIVRALERELRLADRSVLLVDTANTPARELAANAQLRDEVDGVVFISPQSLLRDIDSALTGSRAVLVNRPSSTIPSVICDDAAAFDEAYAQFASWGHRRVAFVAGPRSSWMSGRRATLASSAARRHGLDFRLLGPVAASVEAGKEAARLLAATDATAAVLFDDLITFSSLSHLAALGFRVPGDLSVVGCDNLAITALCTPALSSIGADPADLARAVIALLNDSSPGSLQAEQIAVESTLIKRDSVGPAPDYRPPPAVDGPMRQP